MKRSLVYLMLLAVALFGVSMVGVGTSTVSGADTVTYTMPYLHTAAANVVYCVISNNTSDNATVAVYLTATAAATLTTTSGDKITTSTTANKTVQAFQTSMLTFDQTNILLTISDGTNTSNNTIGGVSGVSGNYGAYIVLTSTNTNVTANSAASLSCERAPMACFQGTTSPKRNLVGYQCKHSNTTAGFAATPANSVYTY
ncbi:MAG: hypothetical protein HQL06_07755 [Nitrospirae bacterium]|nr:hypothetical protein [Nitrospirota bacterium]